MLFFNFKGREFFHLKKFHVHQKEKLFHLVLIPSQSHFFFLVMFQNPDAFPKLKISFKFLIWTALCYEGKNFSV